MTPRKKTPPHSGPEGAGGAPHGTSSGLPDTFPGTVMAAGEFKTHCLRVMEEVAEYQVDVLITKHGRPVARLVPVEDDVPDSFGSLQGTVGYGDVDLAAPDFEAWHAQDS